VSVYVPLLIAQLPLAIVQQPRRCITVLLLLVCLMYVAVFVGKLDTLGCLAYLLPEAFDSEMGGQYTTNHGANRRERASKID
jgi:hypothetical protein